MRFDERAQRRRKVGRPLVRAHVVPRPRRGQCDSSCFVTWVESQPARLERPSPRKSPHLLHLYPKPDSLFREESCLSTLSRPPPNHPKHSLFAGQAENGSCLWTIHSAVRPGQWGQDFMVVVEE
jgi:hypothetical protein